METKIKVTDGESLASAIKLLRSHKKQPQPLHFFFSKGNFPPHFDDTIHTLLKALPATQCKICSISIQPDFLKAFTFPATATQFCQTIGSNPSLLHLNFVPGQRHIAMSTQHLACILQRARNLETLTCHWTVLGGTTREFSDLASALEGHPALTKLSFQSCVLVRRNRSVGCMGPVLRAIRAIPRLQELALSCWIPYGWIEPNEDRDALFQLVATACQHPTLQHLTLQEPLGRAGLEPILTAIRTSPTLQSVTLDAGQLGLQECTLLGNVLRTNTTLERLSISIQGGANLKDHHLTHILEALQDNTTLQSFTIRSGPSRFNYVPSLPIQTEIRTLLETRNLTLREFKLTPRPQQIDDFLRHLDHYLALNRAGRKYLLEHPDAALSKWVDALAQSNQHLSALFHFLSQNPVLCKMDRKRKSPSDNDNDDEPQRPNKKQRVV